MRRDDSYDFSRRISRHPGYDSRNTEPDMIEGLMIPWTEDVGTIDGAHYHCWIPRDLPKFDQRALLNKFVKAAHQKGDPVSFSYDYLPKAP